SDRINALLQKIDAQEKRLDAAQQELARQKEELLSLKGKDPSAANQATASSTAQAAPADATASATSESTGAATPSETTVSTSAPGNPNASSGVSVARAEPASAPLPKSFHGPRPAPRAGLLASASSPVLAAPSTSTKAHFFPLNGAKPLPF